MSELKGTLLGIILVLILFGTMSVALTNTFNKMSTTVEDKVAEVITEE